LRPSRITDREWLRYTASEAPPGQRAGSVESLLAIGIQTAQAWLFEECNGLENSAAAFFLGRLRKGTSTASFEVWVETLVNFNINSTSLSPSASDIVRLRAASGSTSQNGRISSCGTRSHSLCGAGGVRNAMLDNACSESAPE
jgi:hypothetical protein